MLDWYSSYPAPGPREASQDIATHIISNKSEYEEIKDKVHLNVDELTQIAHDYYSQNIPEWSYTAWCMGGKKEYAAETVKLYAKKHNAKRKIRAVLKTLTYTYLWYKATIERRYMPGGEFETEAAKRWNPILNPNPTPLKPHPPQSSPPPPPNSPKSMPAQGSSVGALRMLKKMKEFVLVG
tara:strand:- start:19 stop:561 length:543 start_codon:yes stop_codon:yes gene_type:complete